MKEEISAEEQKLRDGRLKEIARLDTIYEEIEAEMYPKDELELNNEQFSEEIELMSDELELEEE